MLHPSPILTRCALRRRRGLQHCLDAVGIDARRSRPPRAARALYSAPPRMKVIDGVSGLDPLNFTVNPGWQLSRFGYEEFFNSLHVNSTTDGPACAHADRKVSHPVLLVRRSDAFNPFHAHEMLFSVWSSFLALNLEPCDTSVLLSDLDDDSPAFGPFLEFHRVAFAPVRGVEKMSTLTMMERATCYSRLITTVPDYAHFGVPCKLPHQSKSWSA